MADLKAADVCRAAVAEVAGGGGDGVVAVPPAGADGGEQDGAEVVAVYSSMERQSREYWPPE